MGASPNSERPVIISRDQLKAIMPYGVAKIDTYLLPLNIAMYEFKITTHERAAAFLATVAHESAQLSAVEERLSYSVSALMKTWPRRFPNPAAAAPYARNPIKLANHVYANRGGNGSEASGEGWKHRGAGLLQLTFKSNQAACAKYFGISLDQIGDWLRTPLGAARSSAWFFAANGCNELADKGDFQGICGKVNVGNAKAPASSIIGLADRIECWNRAKEALQCS